jgi:hypothetical protein
MTKPRKAAEPAPSLTEETALGLKPPGERTRKSVSEARARFAERPVRVKVLQTLKGQVLETGPTHSDAEGWGEHLSDTLGTSSQTFAGASMVRLATAIRSNARAPAPTQDEMNAALAIMGAVAPRDELETLIGEQIVAAHFASLDFLARARGNAGEYRDAAAAYTNMATKASRTMAVHVDTLAKLRSGGKQQVEVRYVYVDARGGQNVIGDGAQGVFGGVQTHKGGAFGAKPPQPHELGALAYSPGAPVAQVWSEEPGGFSMSGASDAGPEAVSPSRGQEPRRPEGQGERALCARPENAGAARRQGPDAPHPSDGGA